MAYPTPRPSEMPGIFRNFHDGYGALAVGYGAKIQGGTALADTPAIAFFVERKIEPLKRRRQWRGVEALPGELTLQSGTIVTDVVEISSSSLPANGVRTNKAVTVPGGEITYAGKSGSMACLVRDRSTGQVFALTNNHVAPHVGRRAKFRRNGVGVLTRPVSRTVLHLPDQDFMPFVDRPDDQLRVDASLIGLRDEQVPRFSNVVPHFGAVGRPFEPDYRSLESYRRSLDQLPVFSYSFSTKRRFGTVTHVYGVLDDPVGTTFAKACILILGDDGIAASAPKDSGKLWMTKLGGENRPVGLHFGSQQRNGTRLAAASDFGALCRVWNLSIPA